MDASELIKDITKITAVYNPTLLNGFITQWLVMRERLDANPDLFGKKIQKAQATPEQIVLQDAIYYRYYDFVKKFKWNDSLNVPIVPALHGTESGIAEKIAQTGFANLSSLDEGIFIHVLIILILFSVTCLIFFRNFFRYDVILYR